MAYRITWKVLKTDKCPQSTPSPLNKKSSRIARLKNHRYKCKDALKCFQVKAVMNKAAMSIGVQVRMDTDKWMDKMWCIHTLEYFPTMKRNTNYLNTTDELQI